MVLGTLRWVVPPSLVSKFDYVDKSVEWLFGGPIHVDTKE